MDLDFVWIFRIWIRTFGFGFGCFRQDIGADRDVKMLIFAAVDPVFRAPVVFLRRLVIFSRFSDWIAHRVCRYTLKLDKFFTDFYSAFSVQRSASSVQRPAFSVKRFS